ncbi:hypothetical protein [Sporosarcina sp. FSL K6-2383]|uniref:hypothetical protein n=1 Tax=Sporosarcina sp. FSL K6-2383 TaxID=2921556 RepID=UPI00315ACB3C
MTIELNKYEDRVIVFIDILGFTEHIKLTKNDPAYFNKMKRVFNYLYDYQKDNLDGVLAQKEIGKEVTVFSDSIVISYPTKLEGAVFYLLMDVVHLQLDMLAEGVLFRGGFTVGELCHNDSIVFGPAMIEAYELESKVAVYPRVIVSDKVFNTAIQNGVNPPDQELEYILNLLNQDFDEQFYVDFLSQWQEIDDNSKYFDSLSAIKVVIENAIIAYESKPNVQVKYQWLKRYYNSTLDKIQSQYTENLYIE